MQELSFDVLKLEEALTAEITTPGETSTVTPPSSSQRGAESTTLGGPVTVTETPTDEEAAKWSWRHRKYALPFAAFMMLLCGTLDMVFLSWMNRHEIRPCEGCPKQHFDAQYLQLAINCIGQLVCMPIYWIDLFIAKMRNRKKPFLDFASSVSLEKEQAGPLLWLVPALCDFFGSLLLLYALRITEIDTAQVLRNFTVILCALLSIVFLKRDLKVYQWTGIGILTIGLIVTAYSSISLNPTEADNQWLGPLLVLVSSTVQVFLLVAEERILLNYQCAPFLGVGYIGCWQVAFTVITLAVAHFTGTEDFCANLYAMKSDALVQRSILAFTAAMCIFTASGLAVTKMGAAMLTSIILNMRQVPIYIINLAVGWGTFDLTAMFGLLLACIGFLMYNQLLPTAWWPWLDDKFGHELRIRCHCADLDDEEYSWDSDYVSSWAPTTITTTAHFHPRRKRKRRRRKIRTKIVNTHSSPSAHHTDLNRLDSGSTWICVRRSDEWVVDEEGKRVQ